MNAEIKLVNMKNQHLEHSMIVKETGNNLMNSNNASYFNKSVDGNNMNASTTS